MLSPSRYRILAIGKLRTHWIGKGIDIYLKRLPGLTITELRETTPKKEAKAISSSLKSNESLVVLTEKGEQMGSTMLAERLQQLGSKRLVFCIGGANGFSPDIDEIASWKLSLSPLTFPHEIARLLLIEQIYRVHTILNGSPYHRS